MVLKCMNYCLVLNVCVGGLVKGDDVSGNGAYVLPVVSVLPTMGLYIA